MTAKEYQELLVFTAVAREMSFRGASQRLGLTPSVVSRTIGRLEARIGVRLLNRTTRSVALTPAGALLVERLPPLAAAMAGAVDDAVAMGTTPSGTIRLNLPRIAAELILTPLLARFAAAYPSIALDLTIDDGLSDIVAAGHDAGIRIGGKLVQDMAAVRLTPDLRNAVVGSPSYFQAHPMPDRPRDLLRHKCMNYRWQNSGALYRWQFAEDGRAVELSVTGNLTLNDTGVMLEAALTGMGLACLPDLLVAPLVASARLVRVLEDFCPAQSGFFLYYPLNGYPSAALRAFIDFARAASIDGHAR